MARGGQLPVAGRELNFIDVLLNNLSPYNSEVTFYLAALTGSTVSSSDSNKNGLPCTRAGSSHVGYAIFGFLTRACRNVRSFSLFQS
jgi:hypothetical protein